MTDRLYTAKQVARLIAYTGSDSEITQVIRKIRHWSANDVLVPLGGKNTGTGISRVYDDMQVRIAAIVYELSRYGVTVEMLDTFNEWITESVSFHPNWQKAIDDEEDLLLMLNFGHDEKTGDSFTVVQDKYPLAVTTDATKRRGYAYASGIIINLRAVFRKLTL